MSMLEPKENVLLLLACETAEPPLRIVTENFETPGIPCQILTAGNITQQLLAQVSAVLPNTEWQRFWINPDYSDSIVTADGIERILLLGMAKLTKLPQPTASLKGFFTFPELLRAMPPDRRRAPYLRAWQVFAGGLNDSVVAIETTQLRDALKLENT